MSDPVPETQSVQVAVRVRPFNKREIARNSKLVIRMKGTQTVLLSPEQADKALDDVPDSGKKVFTYDYSYWSHDDRSKWPGAEDGMATQDTIFDDMGRNILKNAYAGFNCTLMAYGQTGSGKSYSMMGAGKGSEGLIPRICTALFEKQNNEKDANLKYQIEVSYLEIYSERIQDLLNPGKKRPSGGLKVREHPETGPYVQDLTSCAVNNYPELETLMSVGNKERTVAATNMNSESSRSHAVFSIVFTTSRFDEMTQMSTDKVSKIRLVDLAGSERVETSGVTGVQLKEAANINKSLTTLGRVISALAKASGDDTRKSKKKTFVPFRDSVLTWLLKDSLGGNSKTIMIAALSPADINYDETLSTLRYASRAKKIINKAVVNEDPNAKIIRSLQKEIEDLRAALAAGGGGEGGPGGAGGAKLTEMEQELEESRKLIEEMKRSWDEKLKETHELAHQRVRELEARGLNVDGGSNELPFLVSLCEDPSMSELIYYLKEGETLVGRKAKDDDKQFIQLKGIGIKKEHCIITNVKGDVFISPCNAKEMADIYLNGELVLLKREMLHGDRLILGQNHVFRFSHAVEEKQVIRKPAEGGKRTSIIGPIMGVSDARRKSLRHRSMSMAKNLGGGDDSSFDWDFATRERVVAQGMLAKILPGSDEEAQLMAERMKMLEAEKDSHKQELVKQQAEYQKLLKKVEEEKKSGGSDAADADTRKELAERLMKILPQVDEANAICKEMNKPVLFEVELAAYSHALQTGGSKPGRHLRRHGSFSAHMAPLARLRQPRDLKIHIKVIRGRTKEEQETSRFSIWDPETFEDKLSQLRILYNAFMDEEDMDGIDDPLEIDPNQLETQLIGTAHIYLAPLYHGEGIQYRAPIVDHRGDYAGLLTVQVYCNPEDVADWDDDSEDDLDYNHKPANGDGDDAEKKMPPVQRQDSDIAAVQPRLGASRMLKREKTAGRIVMKKKVKSHVPKEGEHLPVILRLSRADRIPSHGIRFLEVKYKFGSSPEVFSTDMAEVTPDLHAQAAVRTGRSSHVISRKRSDRLSHPLDFDYTMRHDVPAEEVTRPFLKWLKNDAITFEIWGRFYTGANSDGKAVDDDKKGDDDGDDDDKKRKISFDVGPDAPTRPGSDIADSAEANAASQKLNTVFVAVDVEEKGPSGNFDACMMKESGMPSNESSESRATFRITAGTQHDKRFVITMVQVDPGDFMLESLYKAEVTAITSESITENADGIVLAAPSPGQDRHGIDTQSNPGDDGMPLDLKVWEQYYQIQNKLITVIAEWSPEMSQKLLLRRPSAPGERILVQLRLKAFVSRQTDPIEFACVISLKAYDPTKTVSKVRSFFSAAHASQGRLHAIGSYYNILRVQADADKHDLFEEHHSRMWKMEHAMRIDHIQQNLTLIKLLKANESDQTITAQRNFDTALQIIEEIDQRDSAEDARKVEEKLKKAGKTGKIIWKLIAARTNEDVWRKSGFLCKSGKYNTKWKRRWFMLKPPFLFYFKRPHDEEPKGAIDLIGARVKVPKPTKTAGPEELYAFEIHSLTRAWYLKAANEEEMRRWIEGALEFNEPDSDDEYSDDDDDGPGGAGAGDDDDE